MFKFNLQTDEKLLKIERQAEIILVKPVLIVFILIYAPWAFLIKYELHARFSRLLITWTFLVILYAVYKFILWLINVYLITNKRLIAVIYKSLINKTVLETPIERIHNISAQTKGLAHSLLKIGDVTVQVASLTQPMVLKNLKNPEDIKDFLWKTHRPQTQILRTQKL
ncbi:MAG: PH domain-containing protein [Patescibacteria group bacterium]